MGLHGGDVNTTVGTGAVYLTPLGKTVGDAQLWQFYQQNNSYVIRNKGSGANSYLISDKPNNPSPSEIAGNTVPALGSPDVIDNGMFWQITPWKDNTFYFTNSANSTGWRLQVRNAGNLLAMSSNITAQSRDAQSFQWKQVSAINDQKFSTIDVSGSYLRSKVSC